MPNQHASDHRVLSFFIPRTLDALVRKAARATDQTITDFVEIALYEATKDQLLTPDDYEQIAKDIRAVESARANRVSTKSRTTGRGADYRGTKDRNK
jgi:uncharacterized protein (DUF1778 family)